MLSTSVKIDFILHAARRVLAIEVKAARHAHRTDARPVIGSIDHPDAIARIVFQVVLPRS